MKKMNQQSGLTVVELLISLFIAAAFLTSGYQLYNMAIKDGTEARVQARASDVVYDYLQRYKSSATVSCTATTPLNNSPITVSGLSNTTITIEITCPYASLLSISKISATLKYGTPQQTINNTTYVKP